MDRLSCANPCASCSGWSPRFFLPQRPVLGLNQRGYSPLVCDKIVSTLNAEHKSAIKAQKQLWKLAEIKVSVPQIIEMSGEIGQELHEHLQTQAEAHRDQTLKPQHAEPPNCVAVSTDGGRIGLRGRCMPCGVHEQAWKRNQERLPDDDEQYTLSPGSSPRTSGMFLGSQLCRRNRCDRFTPPPPLGQKTARKIGGYSRRRDGRRCALRNVRPASQARSRAAEVAAEAIGADLCEQHGVQ